MPTADQLFAWLGLVSNSTDVLLVVAISLVVAWIVHLMMQP